MSITLPWRYDAPAGWWSPRDVMVNIRLRYNGTCGQPPLFKQIHRFYGELDQIQQCAEAIKQLKGKLNEHDFNERIRSLTLRQPGTVADAILLQDQRRCEYTRLRLLMQLLLDRFASTATNTLEAVRDARRSLMDASMRNLTVECRHIALAYFNEITDNGHLFKRLEECRKLATEDATNGEGEKALTAFAQRVSPVGQAINAFCRRDGVSDIPADLQIPKEPGDFFADSEIGAMYQLLHNAIIVNLETRKKVSSLENISDADRIERRWGACSIVQHNLDGLLRVRDCLSERIAQWTANVDTVSGEHRLHWYSALIAADHLRLCIAHTVTWAQSTIAGEGDIETSVGMSCERVRTRFDETMARCPQKFEPFNSGGQ
jgi:hypothetical protein